MIINKAHGKYWKYFLKNNTRMARNEKSNSYDRVFGIYNRLWPK